MAKQLLREVKINSVDVTSYYVVSWNVEETFGDAVRDCKIESSSFIASAVTPAPGQTLTIKRGFTTPTDQFVFNGYVDRVDKMGATWMVYGKDKMVDLVRKNVTYSYDGAAFPGTEAKGSDIAKDLIETFGLMTAEVVDTGAILTLNRFICRGIDVLSALQKLCEIYDYQVYYDSADDKVHFEPKGYSTNTDTIIIGGTSNNVSGVPVWSEDNTQCINKLLVKGATQETQEEELFNGTGAANQTFTLNFLPISIQAWEDVAGTWTLKTPGVVDSTSGTYHYTIDKENKKVSVTASWTPASGTNNVKMVYTRAIPVPVLVQDVISQAAYGIHETEKYFYDIENVNDARARGLGFLAKYKDPFHSTMAQPINLIDYEVGQKVNVIDTINDENRDVVIVKIVKSWPYGGGDKVYCGDREWRIADWGKYTLDRIRRLEELNQQDTDFVIQIYQYPVTFGFTERYMRGLIRTPNATTLIWDLPICKWDSGFVWDGGYEADKTARIIWPDYTYTEDFHDEDFKGSGTASWTTSGVVF